MSGYGELAAMVPLLRYKPGWTFALHYGPTSGAGGCAAISGDLPGAPVSSGGTVAVPVMIDGWPVRLLICLDTVNSLDPGQRVRVGHWFSAPWPDAHPPWHAWLLRCIHAVEIHEMCEAFAIGGQRPYFPEHGPGADLYRVTDHGLDLAALGLGA
jgi:hypothetical protein